jgi:Peptidogalycan biosysnthesis/recognition
VAYSYRVFNSIEHADLSEWQRVRSACSGSIVMDPRFIAAVETSTKQIYKFWYIVIYGHDGVAVACTSVCAIALDLADFADPGLAHIIRHMPLLFSRLRHLKIIVCGLPIGGDHTLAIAQRSASPQILPVLDSVICEIASEVNADAIIYKEFEERDFEWTDPLLALGYCRIATPPTHYFSRSFDDFSQYCAALRKHYRKQINRSRRKLICPGVELMIVTDSNEIVRAYTFEVHALYRQMAERAAVRLGVLPIEFLHQAALRFGDHVELIAIRKDARIIAFACCLHTQSTYYTMYGGLDYHLNSEYDLYFNLIYALLARGFQKRVSTIVFGIGGDTVKSRMGCHSEQLYLFAKGRRPLLSLIIRLAGNFLIAQRPAAAPFKIFKDEVLQNSNDRRPATT